MKLLAALLMLLFLAVLPTAAQTPMAPQKRTAPTIPALPREFRGVWVATVTNLDWPSKPGLTTDQQKAELIALLDKAVALHLNAIIFQVRPACDALYQSSLEPWSEYLTGRQGQAPEPFYDPLAFAVAEAHKRGLELHAWFNPYRARLTDSPSPTAPNHISRTHPELVKTYGKYLWLDPGEPAVQEHSLAVILDVVRRYDIDGVHLDDYFYPYKVNDAAGKPLDFPDDPSWQKYRAAGGTRSRADWRRDNVSQFIHHLYTRVKAVKPWVKVGISPFGIWRPGAPPQVKGFDAYSELYANSHEWLANGWVDYFAPQLYWKIEQTPQSFPALLEWWASQNFWHRHLWPGLYTGRVEDRIANWPASEIEYQVRTTRGIAGATGDIHFSMSVLMEDRGQINERLLAGVYADLALVPASPWLDATLPGRPRVTSQVGPGGVTFHWAPTGDTPVWLWAVQTRVHGVWTARILPTAETDLGLSEMPEVFVVSAVSRVGNQSLPSVSSAPAAGPEAVSP